MFGISSSPHTTPSAVPSSRAAPGPEWNVTHRNDGLLLWHGLQCHLPLDDINQTERLTPRQDNRLGTLAPLPDYVDRSLDAHLVRPGTIAMTLPPRTPGAMAAMAGVFKEQGVGLVIDLTQGASIHHPIGTGGEFEIPGDHSTTRILRIGESPVAGLPTQMDVATLRIGLTLGPERQTYGNPKHELQLLRARQFVDDPKPHPSGGGSSVSLPPEDLLALARHMQTFREQHPGAAVAVISHPNTHLAGQLIAAEVLQERFSRGQLPRSSDPVDQRQYIEDACDPLRRNRGTMMPGTRFQATALVALMDRLNHEPAKPSPDARRAPAAPPPVMGLHAARLRHGVPLDAVTTQRARPHSMGANGSDSELPDLAGSTAQPRRHRPLTGERTDLRRLPDAPPAPKASAADSNLRDVVHKGLSRSMASIEHELHAPRKRPWLLRKIMPARSTSPTHPAHRTMPGANLTASSGFNVAAHEPSAPRAPRHWWSRWLSRQ